MTVSFKVCPISEDLFAPYTWQLNVYLQSREKIYAGTSWLWPQHSRQQTLKLREGDEAVIPVKKQDNGVSWALDG